MGCRSSGVVPGQGGNFSGCRILEVVVRGASQLEALARGIALVDAMLGCVLVEEVVSKNRPSGGGNYFVLSQA